MRHLRAALAVARHSNFRRAAEEVHLSQPALSLAVSELERNLGVTLFDRTSRMVRPTQVGEAFLAGAGRLVGDLDGLVQNVGDMAMSRRGRVVETCLSSVASRILPVVIRECERVYPAVEVVLRDDVASRLLEVVQYGEADIGVTMLWQYPHEELCFDPLLQDPFYLVCDKDHALAAKSEAVWQDLADETFIAFATTSGSHAVVTGELQRQAIDLRRTIMVSQLATVHGMLEGRVGISVLPRLALPVDGHPSLVARPLVEPVICRTIGIVRRKDRSASPAAGAFQDILGDVVSRMFPEDRFESASKGTGPGRSSGRHPGRSRRPASPCEATSPGKP